jgi:hypothetical protein
MANSTNNPSDASDTPDLGQILKWAVGAIIATYGVKKVGDALTDHNRKDTALIAFDQQNLSLWVKNRLKDAYRARDFYITKFPDTPPAVFPKAVRILYDLIQFHGRGKRDDWLGHEILRECEELHRIAVRLNCAPLNQPWEYWRLVGKKVKTRNFWGIEQERVEFIPNPNWNLEGFLNEDFGGLVKFGLFGVKDKSVDIMIYEKDWFGTLKKGEKIDLSQNSIRYIYDRGWAGRQVVVIYDMGLSRKDLNQRISGILKYYNWNQNICQGIWSLNLPARFPKKDKEGDEGYENRIKTEFLKSRFYQSLDTSLKTRLHEIDREFNSENSLKDLVTYPPAPAIDYSSLLDKVFATALGERQRGTLDNGGSLRVALRDSLYRKPGVKSFTCRYCYRTIDEASLQLHHLWPFKKPELSKTQEEFLFRIMKDEFLLLSNKIQEEIWSIFQKLLPKNKIKSMDDLINQIIDLVFNEKLPSGPEEEWNMIYVCTTHFQDSQGLTHHPIEYEEQIKNVLHDEYSLLKYYEGKKVKSLVNDQEKEELNELFSFNQYIKWLIQQKDRKNLKVSNYFGFPIQYLPLPSQIEKIKNIIYIPK